MKIPLDHLVEGREKLRQVGEPIKRFTADTATKTGRSERDIQRDATRGTRIDETVLADIQGSDLDKGATLDALAALPRDQQAGEVERLRLERVTPTAPVSAPIAPKRDCLDKWGESAPLTSLGLLPDEIEILVQYYADAVKSARPTKGRPHANEWEARSYAYYQEREVFFRDAFALVAPPADDEAETDLVDQAPPA